MKKHKHNKSAQPEITLTEGQQNAFDRFLEFLVNPNEPVFILEGYAGTGKSTLVRELFNKLPDFLKSLDFLGGNAKKLGVYLTATTNKAASALSIITNQEVRTIHSFLNLRVKTQYTSGIETYLVPTSTDVVKNSLVFIDEASYIDNELLRLIFKYIDHNTSKIVFMGDPAQLTPVRSTKSPVFDLKAPRASLTEVVRQSKDNPIIDLATRFRGVVNGEDWFSFTTDNIHIKHMDKEEFEKTIKEEFSREDWKYHDSKILAWTNKKVIEYNNLIKEIRTGDTVFTQGDIALNNEFVKGKDRGYLSTDELVQILEVTPTQQLGVDGFMYTVLGVNGPVSLFGPKHLQDKKDLIKKLTQEGNIQDLAEVEGNWVDLRDVYACTINKSQGSTYDKVYIDLSDIAKCKQGNLMARLLYVAVSRAKNEVILTGDLV